MSPVTCVSCSQVNDTQRKFCGECGAPLPLLCPACGMDNARGMKFCGECGGTLLSTPAPGEGIAPLPRAAPSGASSRDSHAASLEERRLVTALFCDLVGFTPMSETLDPEDVRDIQSDYFSAMAGQIERYGGTVEKYAGDAVLALFGVPIAHEDDAERAVLCALGMQGVIEPIAATARTQWQVDLSIRVGINTGEVVSGTWTVSGRQDVAVTGDAVNTAARLQAAAEPGEVLVGTETMTLTRRRIRYGERREVVLKGKSGIVPVYPALGLRERFEERWEMSDHHATPLIGRDREMATLLDAWDRAQSGDGQLVTVIGDAGVGKSRVLAEMIDGVAAGTAIRVVRARCLSYSQSISLWLIADLLRSVFRIAEDDDLQEVRATLGAMLSTLLAHCDAETGRDATDVLGEVLGLPPGDSLVARAEPQIRRQALLRSLKLLLGALLEQAPAVLVLEDVHWIDPASEDVIKEILADVPGLRLLVLMAQRPGWAAPWSEWGWTERLTLRPLGGREAALLAGAVLGGMTLSAEVQDYVAERAGGNPFFVEELLRALEESGGLEEREGAMVLVRGAAERLPSTLTEILLARLDRLEAQVRNVAQVASVIGRSFAVRLLARVMEREQTALELPLSALQHAEIAFPRGGSELEYIFKHVTMREVAYNTLVQKRRGSLHLQTARAIAALYPSGEYVEMIAYHYGKTEAPESTEWLEKAGDRAGAMYANDEAIGYYEEALRRVASQASEQGVLARLEEKAGTVLYTRGHYDRALEHLGRAAEICHTSRDLEGAGRIVARMGMVHRELGTPEEGIALVSPMIDLLSSSGPSEALAALRLSLANLLFMSGRYRDMLAAAEEAGTIARAIGNNWLLGEAEERRGVALGNLDQPGEARHIIAGAIPSIEAGGNLRELARALNNAGWAADMVGDLKAARQYNERAVEVLERVGNPEGIAFHLAGLASNLLIVGDWEEAHRVLERASTLVSEKHMESTAYSLHMRGMLALREGDWEEAECLEMESLNAATRCNNHHLTTGAQSLLAELDIMRGRSGEAVTRLHPLVESEDAHPDILTRLAWSLLEVGDVEGAARTITRAMDWMRGHWSERQADALRIHGMVLIRLGQTESSVSVLEEGLAVAQSLPSPYVEARILEVLGRQEEALAIFQRLGAQKDVERLEWALS